MDTIKQLRIKKQVEDLGDKAILAVDGDIIAYRTACVVEDHWEGAGYDIVNTTISQIMENTGVNKMRIYLSGKSDGTKYPAKKQNFRYDIAKTKPYKGNRANMKRPQFLNHIYDYLIEHKNAIVVDGYEADDAIATDMTFYESIHCGIDKDILQIPGLHYNYVKEEWIEVTPEDAEITLYRQVLMGDTSDNIPGLPRFGIKTAEAHITKAESALSDALDTYKKVIGADYMGYFLEQRALVEMVKNVPLNFTRIYTEKLHAFEEYPDGFIDFDEEEKLEVAL